MPVSKKLFCLFVGVSSTIFGKNLSKESSLVPSDNSIDRQASFVKVLSNHGNVVSEVVSYGDHIGNMASKNKKIAKQRTLVLDIIAKEEERLKSLDFSNVDKVLVDSVMLYYESLKSTINSEYNIVLGYKYDMEQTHEHVNRFYSLMQAADESFVNAEKNLYAMESRYASAYKFTLPASEEQIIKKVLYNDSLMKYHNNMYMEFVKIMYKEVEYFDAQSKMPVSKLGTIRKDFAQTLFDTELRVNALGAFKKDVLLQGNIKAYLNFLRKQYFKDPLFYNDYMQIVNEKYNHKQNSKTVGNIHSKLSTKSGYDYNKRNEILNNIEEVSYNFLVIHSPSFKE